MLQDLAEHGKESNIPCNLFMAFKCTVASTSDWPPDKNVIPGTAAGVVLCKVVTVASAICSGVYLVGHDCPVKITQRYTT